MPTTTPGQTSFNGGEISPRMFGRTDLNQYLNSVAILENMTCLTQGPAMRRSGSRFVHEVVDSSVQARLEPFIFSTTDAYTLEFGDQSMRVYKNEGFISQPDSVFNATNVDFANDAISIRNHFYADNYGPFRLEEFGTLPDPLMEGVDYYIQYIDADTIGLRTTPGGTPVVLSDAGVNAADHKIVDPNTGSSSLPMTIHAPWTESQLQSLAFAQSADVMFVAAGGTTPVYKIERRGDQDWRIVEVAWQDGPYLSENAVEGWILNPSATSGDITVLVGTDAFNTSTGVDLADDTIAMAAHGLLDNVPFMFEVGSTTLLPEPLEEGVIYYTKLFGDTHVQLRYNKDGPVIDLTVLGANVIETVWFPLFKSSDVGRLLRLFRDDSPDEYAWMEITSYVSEIEVTAQIRSGTMANSSAHERWSLGAFAPNDPALGEPSAVSFNEQRLVLAANPGGIQTIYASALGDFENFQPSPRDDPVDPTAQDAFDYTIAANQRNSIQWLRPVRSLLVGTLGGIWPMQASSQGEAITPDNVQIRQSSVHGTSNVQPVNVDDAVVYVSDTLHKLFAVGYTFERDAFLSTDLTTLAEHITAGGITQIAFAHEPSSIIWCVRADGQLLSLTFDSTQRIQGWARHILGGSFDGGDAVVESVSVVPSPDGSHDQAWISVKRTINGETKRYVEFIEENFGDSADVDAAFFVDSGLSSNTGPTLGPFNLPHLIGETVQILADGAPVTPQVVDAQGQVTLSKLARSVSIGLPYVSQLKSLPITPQDPEGTSVGKLKRIATAAVRFVRTVGGEIAIGSDGAAFDPIIFREGGDAMDTATAPFSGIVNVPVESGWSEDVFFWIRQTLPLPQTVAAAQVRVSSSER